MNNIVLLSGSPFPTSKSNQVLRYVGNWLEEDNYRVTHISTQDIPLEDLVYGKFDSPIIQRIGKQIENAQGIVVVSPVYKAAYTGVLKLLIDVLPQDIFKSKPVLPIMTGGSSSHLLALEYTLRPLIAILQGHSLRGVYILDNQIDRDRENPIIDDDINERMTTQLHDFINAMQERKITIAQ